MERADVPIAAEVTVVIVNVDDPEPPVMVAGLKVPVAPEGRPVTDNAVSPVNPLIEATVTV
jgi:hypothetical protein